MYGVWRLGLSPAPAAGGSCLSNGLGTAAESAAEPNAARSAFLAESASRRRPRQAAYDPASAAYATRPSETTSAARPSSAIRYVCFVAGAYFDGHFVTSVFGIATNVSPCILPS